MSDRKTEILETAADIIRTKSFHAFGFREIAERLGIRKASIHHHFPTKDSLALALIDYYAVKGECLMDQLASAATSPGHAIEQLLDMAESVLVDREHAVCPTEAFGVDGQDLSESVRKKLREIEDEHIQVVANLLDSARASGEVSFLGDPLDQSVLIHAALQGARQSARLEGPARFRTTVQQLKRVLGLTVRSDSARAESPDGALDSGT